MALVQQIFVLFFVVSTIHCTKTYVTSPHVQETMDEYNSYYDTLAITIDNVLEDVKKNITKDQLKKIKDNLLIDNVILNNGSLSNARNRLKDAFKNYDERLLTLLNRLDINYYNATTLKLEIYVDKVVECAVGLKNLKNVTKNDYSLAFNCIVDTAYRISQQKDGLFVLFAQYTGYLASLNINACVNTGRESCFETTLNELIRKSETYVNSLTEKSKLLLETVERQTDRQNHCVDENVKQAEQTLLEEKRFDVKQCSQ